MVKYDQELLKTWSGPTTPKLGKKKGWFDQLENFINDGYHVHLMTRNKLGLDFEIWFLSCHFGKDEFEKVKLKV
jgi:hypothetical protein